MLLLRSYKVVGKWYYSDPITSWESATGILPLLFTSSTFTPIPWTQLLLASAWQNKPCMTEDAVPLRYETRVCAALHTPHTRTALVTQCGKPTYPAVGSGPTSAISVVAKMIEPMGCHPDPNTNKQTNHTHAQIPPMWALSGLHSRAHMPARAMTPSSLATSCRNTPAGPFGLSKRTRGIPYRNIHRYSAEVETLAVLLALFCPTCTFCINGHHFTAQLMLCYITIPSLMGTSLALTPPSAQPALSNPLPAMREQMRV